MHTCSYICCVFGLEQATYTLNLALLWVGVLNQTSVCVLCDVVCGRRCQLLTGVWGSDQCLERNKKEREREKENSVEGREGMV